MNRGDYIRDRYRQLRLRKLNEDPTLKVAEEVTKIIQNILDDKLTSEKNFEFFTKNELQEGRFYLLIKIHKKATPGRPICSTVCHP